MTTKPNRIERYYETHEWEGDEVGQGRLHFVVIKYLVAVIEWLFYGQAVGVMSDVYIFQTTEYKEAPLSPDLVVVDGLNLESAETEEKPSYQIGEDGPPPRVVIEVSSKSTWLDDLNPKGKRNKYFAVGIPEYFVFDPQQTTLWRDSWAKCNRLVGWRRNPLTGEYEELVKDEVGRLWSEELQSWLVVEGRYLRLYTRDGQLRLTEAQAERQQLNLERAKARAALQEEKQQRELER
ncbi:MAG: Uma2 family endonuclease, partial [Chloroflexi bacterium]|nr:Uma2 family endonuclease [Chloroflexota bacterium]